jgi:putative membrane protein
MMEIVNLKYVINSLVFSLLGVIVFWVSFIIIDKITPYDLWRELVEKRNQPLAIVAAAMCLGVAIIVAAAIHG